MDRTTCIGNLFGQNRGLRLGQPYVGWNIRSFHFFHSASKFKRYIQKKGPFVILKIIVFNISPIFMGAYSHRDPTGNEFFCSPPSIL